MKCFYVVTEIRGKVATFVHANDENEAKAKAFSQLPSYVHEKTVVKVSEFKEEVIE